MPVKPELLADRGRFIGCEMQHEWPLHDVLNDILLPNGHINRIVEIGTGHGALSIVLGLFAIKIDAKIMTVDIDPALSDDSIKLFKYLKIRRLIGDEYGKKAKDFIKNFIFDEPTYMLCDGHNKDWELRYWHCRLNKGSLISVHDWLDAVKPHRVPESLIPYKPEDWDRSRLATWRI